MSLLGPPVRPQLGWVYDMPADYYDTTDRIGHPTLVVAVDDALQQARVVTRTSQAAKKGRRPVGHPASRTLRLDRPGWWRLDRLHPVPYVNFEQEDTYPVGPLEPAIWDAVVRTLREGS